MNTRHVASIMMGLLFIVCAVMGIYYALGLPMNNTAVSIILAVSLIVIGLLGIKLSRNNSSPDTNSQRGETYVEHSTQNV